LTEIRVRPTAHLLLVLPVLLSAACATAAPKPVTFPEPAVDGPRGAITRAELQAKQESLPGGSSEARLIEVRLREGDFQVGDRIFLRVLEDTTLTDTFPVRAGKMLQLPLMAEIPLEGILRAELQPYLARKIGQYVRNPTVEATPLLRVAILGGVGRPGYYNLPADILLSDAVMLAGGPAGTVRLDKSKVQRLGTEIYDADAVVYALNQGVTLDRMSLIGGDVVDIGQDKLGRTESSLRTFSYLLAIPLSIAAVIALF
jgi:protein involved in polysaccharide export with SLBB domain